MSLGIGLGAFVSGLEHGMNVREKIDATSRERKHRKAISDINADTKKAFGEAVESGALSPDQYDKFWMQYAMPKMKMQMIEAGDYAGAKAFEEWGRSDAALEGGRYAASALLKAQTGDGEGALQDAIKSANTQGYINHDFQLVGTEKKIDEESGQELGSVFKIKNSKGEIVEQFVKRGDEGRVIGLITNPQNAWQTQQAAKIAEAEKQKTRAENIDDFEAKERIKAKYSSDKKNEVKPLDYEKQYEATAKRMAENDFNWSSRSPEEQRKLVETELKNSQNYAAGRTSLGITPQQGVEPEDQSTAKGKLIVDKKSGKILNPDPIAPDEKSTEKQGRVIGLGL